MQIHSQIRPKRLAMDVMNSQTSLKEMFNETKPKLPHKEEHEAADEPTQQNTDSLYLAIPAPVPGVCQTLALVLWRPHGLLGCLDCLQRPRCCCGAGGGPGVGGSLVMVAGSPEEPGDWLLPVLSLPLSKECPADPPPEEGLASPCKALRSKRWRRSSPQETLP